MLDLATIFEGSEPAPAPTAGGLDYPAEASDEYNEGCWADITDVDRAYLLGPRERPTPCLWCGGRTRHGALCEELHKGWELKLPWGAHRGKRLSEVPTDYLNWLLRKADLQSELRAGILAAIQAARGGAM